MTLCAMKTGVAQGVPTSSKAVLCDANLRRSKYHYAKAVYATFCASRKILTPNQECFTVFFPTLSNAGVPISRKTVLHDKDCHRVKLLCATKYEGDKVDLTSAKSEAKLLHEKISDKAYNDDDIIRILATWSKAQINATLDHCKKRIRELGFDECFYAQDLKADPNEYLAILRATKKRGTDEGALTGVVDTRAEVGMKIIKDLYHKRNSVPLYQAIKEDTTLMHLSCRSKAIYLNPICSTYDR
ncbi:hypothetical protein DVH24_042515 [Malus domestica]|uniref:Uncharacterized protein n=1 Tax=Malus domestica TaxID=3750 RepID=A0A498JH52_MALDO|nr:hypothetical protein DVH24_042515 [Malus domestica]